MESQKEIQSKAWRIQELERELLVIEDLRNDYIELQSRYNEEIERKKWEYREDDVQGHRHARFSPEDGSQGSDGSKEYSGDEEYDATGQIQPGAMQLGGLLGFSGPSKKLGSGSASKRSAGEPMPSQIRNNIRKLSSKIGYKFVTPRGRIGDHIIEKLEGAIPTYEIEFQGFTSAKMYNASRTIKNMMGDIYSRKRGKAYPSDAQ